MSTTATTTKSDFFESSVLGQPAGLFVMFFTEMWERFSYYGMRALLVIFLVSGIDKGGWGWTTEKAMALYGTYTMGVYLTPVIGGLIADKLLGYRWAVLLGALIMTLGHASMALETETFLYIGLGCLMAGNGLFKPNMTSMISNLYKDHPEKKDGAYSIFYMGVNAGAFLGILLCGYIGEKVSYSWGFGLAGIFMFLGLLQFYFTQGIFGEVGLAPKKEKASKAEQAVDNTPQKIIIDRLIVVFIFSVFTIFFWAAFEQAGGSMTIFADRYTQRVLTGNAGMTYKIIDAILTIAPVGIITYVLISLFGKTFKKYSIGNIILALSFVAIWGLVIWRVNREFSAETTEVAATWFGILNSLFIITLAPLFSKWWESKYNLPGAVKFGLGLVLLGLGFGFLAYGSMPIVQGAEETVRVSMVWLILAYLFHTMGELCISPVGLSYVSKLVPAAWIGMMFGVYYLFIAMGNKIAGSMGGMIEEITAKYSLTTFFLIFTAVPIGLGIIITALHPLVKKLMHGVK
ncbi:MFS transporter [Flavobacterium sp. Sd200]|uniref:peptide MFS transporter n=1 Tax=Flavobacterium sp. Sd200 TaxID=2692211 RepID=UPI00136D75AB|nr:peptide MFS transporter [Flavobacterium sp. Sd200]MXN92225.1 MFS transporter [Flavobacterium sp. Sd200]